MHTYTNRSGWETRTPILCNKCVVLAYLPVGYLLHVVYLPIFLSVPVAMTWCSLGWYKQYWNRLLDWIICSLHRFLQKHTHRSQHLHSTGSHLCWKVKFPAVRFQFSMCRYFHNIIIFVTAKFKPSMLRGPFFLCTLNFSIIRTIYIQGNGSNYANL